MRTCGCLALLVVLAACTAAPTEPTDWPDARCTGTACRDAGRTDVRDEGRTDARGDLGTTDIPSPPDRSLASVEILPMNPSLTSVDGAPLSHGFTVIGHRRDGSTTDPLTGLWSVPAGSVGTIEQNTGRFSTNGQVGGTVTVHVEVAVPGAMPLTAETTVTVSLRRTILEMGVPAAAPTVFAGEPMRDPARAVAVLYPQDGVVMPQNVYPADIQWSGGVAGDVYRLTLHKVHCEVVAYVLHTGTGFQFHWLPEVAAWRAFAQSDGDAAATLTVDRWDNARNEVVAGSPVNLRFANASISGSVYYWDIAAGRSVRIDDGTATPISYMPRPPAGVDGNHCVGCHAVSMDGRWFSGRLGGDPYNNIGAVFDLTVDLSGDPPPTVFPVRVSPPTVMWGFSTFNPDASRLLIEQRTGFSLLDPHTGTLLPLATGSQPLPATVPGRTVTHPSWSPDGRTIVHVANANSWGGDFTAGDIATFPVPGPDTFGASTVIHTGASIPGTGNADSYPTWSPDSRLIAFAHGTGCRSESHQAALYLMNFDGTGLVRLSRASGGAMTINTFQPHFSPFHTGGYFWLAFLSRRDYGNAQRGTRGTGRQQIWITAISDHAMPGEDPSEVAYWLPGQATASQNIAAFWAPRPCRPNGQPCGVSTECCSGICGSDGMGHSLCQPPPVGMCHLRGQGCGGTDDCCRGLTCVANVCDIPPG